MYIRSVVCICMNRERFVTRQCVRTQFHEQSTNQWYFKAKQSDEMNMSTCTLKLRKNKTVATMNTNPEADVFVLSMETRMMSVR